MQGGLSFQAGGITWRVDQGTSGKGMLVLGLPLTHRFPELFEKLSGTFFSWHPVCDPGSSFLEVLWALCGAVVPGSLVMTSSVNPPQPLLLTGSSKKQFSEVFYFLLYARNIRAYEEREPVPSASDYTEQTQGPEIRGEGARGMGELSGNEISEACL